MPLIQWIMLGLEGRTYITGSAALESDSYLIAVVSGAEIPSMVDFLGGLADTGLNFKYPTDFSF